jgi:outer membrane protein OmpA-like peptidoglycan-associated protein
MKKLLIVLAFAGVSVASMAQTEAVPTEKYSVATNSFWSNWFVQLGANWNAFYSDTEHGFKLDKSNSPFNGDRSKIGFAVAVGKWFTPGLGIRLKAQGFQGKQLYGAYGQEMQSRDFKYWILNGHGLFNLSNLLYGYNPDRVWNFIPFVGGGLGRTMTDNFYAMDLSFGLLNEFRLSKKVLLNVEIGWNRLEEDFDGRSGHNIHGSAARGWEDKDNNVYAEVGLTFNLGKGTWDKVPNVDALNALHQSQLDALKAQLNDLNNENADLKNQLANIPEPGMNESVKEFVTTPISVFFDLNKTEIASQKDLVNVRALAKYAIENNTGIMVTGFADSATGTPEINQRLSDGRAAQVVEELVKMGLAREKMQSAGNGSVETLSPMSFNRRATVQIIELPE